VLHTEILWKISLKITNMKAENMINNITTELTEIMQTECIASGL